mmetsp:Transcript_8837/g.19215  ORF Transcript_8837/g.19215 Transcript_8837/m.19215 type:complete len:219 (-) Transcript_8837:299-955(-)
MECCLADSSKRTARFCEDCSRAPFAAASHDAVVHSAPLSEADAAAELCVHPRRDRHRLFGCLRPVGDGQPRLGHAARRSAQVQVQPGSLQRRAPRVGHGRRTRDVARRACLLPPARRGHRSRPRKRGPEERKDSRRCQKGRDLLSHRPVENHPNSETERCCRHARRRIPKWEVPADAARGGTAPDSSRYDVLDLSCFRLSCSCRRFNQPWPVEAWHFC